MVGKGTEGRGQEKWFIPRRPVGYGGQVAYGWMETKIGMKKTS